MYANMLISRQKYYSKSYLVESIALSELCKDASKTDNLSYIKLKSFALLLQVLRRFEYFNSYQVLHNVTYVATHLSSSNLY